MSLKGEGVAGVLRVDLGGPAEALFGTLPVAAFGGEETELERGLRGCGLPQGDVGVARGSGDQIWGPALQRGAFTPDFLWGWG